MERRAKSMLASIATTTGRGARPRAKRTAVAGGEVGAAALMAMAGRARRPAGKPAPPAAAALEGTIEAEWTQDPAIQREFRDFKTYAAWRRRQHCKSARLSISELANEVPNVSAYVATLEARGARLSPTERAAIEKHAVAWQASADVRREFRTFPVFASYMRAKESGRVRTLGV